MDADSGPGQAWLSDSLAVDCKPHHACTVSFRERERERERESFEHYVDKKIS